jgi:dTMP kinase
MQNSKGQFIVFEGLDGSGKSTQIKYLANKLLTKGLKVYETCEPTDSPIGSLIHQIMIGRIHSDQKTIAALFVADRIDHLLNDVNGIYDKVMNGVIVISDRYYFSSYAYHGIHIPIEWVINANSLSEEILRPDINIFLDLSPEKCLDRLNKERWHFELYENIENMRSVRKKYLESFKILKDKEKVIIINADTYPNEIAENIWNSIKHMF